MSNLRFRKIGLFLVAGTMLTIPLVAQSVQVVNAAYESPLAPGAVANIYGTNLATGSCYASSVPWPNESCGTRVTVDGIVAPIGVAFPGQLTIQIPSETAAGDAELVIEVEGQAPIVVTIEIREHAPALYTVQQGGEILGAFTNISGAGTVTVETPAAPGDNIIAFLSGLGRLDPANPLVVEALIGCAPVPVLFAGPSASFQGVDQVTFSVPQGFSGGIHEFKLRVGNETSNAVKLPVGGDPTPYICSVSNGASFAPPDLGVAGALMTVKGLNFGEEDLTVGLFPSTTVNGVSVTFDGDPAPLFHIIGSIGQITLVGPPDLPESGNVEVQVTTPEGIGPVHTIEMIDALPGIFRVADPSTGRGYAAVLHTNTAWLPVSQEAAEAIGLPTDCDANGINPASYCAKEAAAGDPLQVFVTGLGKATPGGDANGQPLAKGQVAPADGSTIYWSVIKPRVLVGDMEAKVIFWGLAPGFAGLYQINFVVPAGAESGDFVPITVMLPNGEADTAGMAIVDRTE